MNLNELTIQEAHEKLQKKEISSFELTQACIKRIEDTDDKIKAFLAKDYNNALDQAKQVDAKIKKGDKLRMLEGIPCGIKDLILTQGIETTAASNMLRNYVPLFNATVIDKLKDNGAII